MKQATYDNIMNAYHDIEDREPDISTERLLSMTAAQAGVEYDLVVEALRQSAGVA